MTIEKEKLKALVERVTTDRRFCADEHHRELANGVSALLAEIERTEGRLHDVARLCATVEQERDQLKAENEALRKSIAGKVVCDLELFEDLRDSAAAEADGHRQSMGSYRPQRQEVLDHTVSRCDLLIAAAKEASHG